VIQKYTEPSTDVEYTLATGTGDDPYDGGMDRFGRIIKLRWQRGSTVLINYDYTYDRVGNKKSLQDNSVSLQSFYAGELYGYDDLYRLESYDRGQLSGGTISNPNLTQDWTLDQTGNWTDFDQGVVGVINQARTHNTSNEITEITEGTSQPQWPTPMYDDNGNTTSLPQPLDLESSYDATWDAWNRLVRLEDGDDTVAEYAHDGLGRRIIKRKYVSGTLSETVHYYMSSSSQVLEERVDSETDAAQQFVWGIRFVDDLVLRDKDLNSDGVADERLYTLADPRFSVLAVTDDSGSVQERYSYAAYGKTTVLTPAYAIRTSSSFDWEFRYTGRRLDLETALYYFRARYYHAQLGRFISRDPIGYVDGMNLYRAYFVPGQTDPQGLRKVCCTFRKTTFGIKICPRLHVGFTTKEWDQTVDKGISESPAQACARVANAETPPWKVIRILNWGCHEVTEYGQYCGRVRTPNPNIPNQCNFWTVLLGRINPPPIDDVDMCCFLHDCCLPNLIPEWMDTCHHKECNEAFLTCLARANCSKSPTPIDCEVFKLKAMILVKATICTSWPLP
jgi:RHS repeat-associated protein